MSVRNIPAAATPIPNKAAVSSTATIRIDISLLFLDSASRVDDLTFFPLSVIGYLKRIISHHQRIEKDVFSDKLQLKLRLQVPLSDLCLQKRILQKPPKSPSKKERVLYRLVKEELCVL